MPTARRPRGLRGRAPGPLRRDASDRTYIPALRFGFLTRFYDPVLALTTREGRFKRALLEQAALAPEHRVLDLGCGTGTLLLHAKRGRPQAGFVGLDADGEILGRARARLVPAGAEVALVRGLADALPFADASFDRVLSSLFFHHLLPDGKLRTLAEVARVLRPGGELHVADWGRPRSVLQRAAFLSIQLLDGFANTVQHVRGELPQLFERAGLVDVRVGEEIATLYGTLTLYRARRPAS